MTNYMKLIAAVVTSAAGILGIEFATDLSVIENPLILITAVANALAVWWFRNKPA